MSAQKTDFTDQVVLVVGGARGIGAAAATLIKSRGGIVYPLDISLPADNNIDMGDKKSIQATVDRIFQKHLRIDAVINCAGIVGPTNVKAEDVNWDDYQKVLTINLFGTIWLTQSVLGYMKKAKYGRIVHVASIAGKEGNPGMSPYNTSKSGMIGFIKGVAKEVASEGITINAVAPAVIATPMNADTSEETLKYMISRIPIGRLGQSEEVAELLAFIASEACSFTTGFTFDASGGRATY